MSVAWDAALRATEAFNEARLWRSSCRVWSQKMSAASFDRWLYLRLHQAGVMGGDERARLGRLVKPGMTVVDVGANIGLYTVLLSRLVGPAGRILAFEPDPVLATLLQQNVTQNAAANVTVHRIALGRERERRTLHKLVLNAGDSHLGNGYVSPMRRAIETEVAPLDAIEPALRPDLVKIDVQGWELPVLQGMRGILAAQPGVMVQLEFWPGGARRAGFDPLDPFRLLRELGFNLRLEPDGPALDEPQLEALCARLTGLKHVDVLARRPR